MVKMFGRWVVGAAAFVASVSANAQVGITAGGDGRGERLEQKRLELTADVNGHFAQVKAAHIFKGKADWRTELDIIYTLPDGAIPTEFAYYYKGERVPAFITEKERAKQIYKNITTRMQDPALIEFIGKKTFRVRIFPVEAGQDLRMEVGWIQIAKTTNGVPTFDFPIKMRKQDPLSEVSATVRVKKQPWLKRAMESIGLKASAETDGEVYRFDQKAVRPRKDWRFSLVPLAGQSPVTFVSGRSGSEKGFATVASSSSGRSASLNSPMTMSVGGTSVVSGTYGPSSPFSQEVIPNHVGLKIWAYQRIRALERSAKNREQVVELSLRHNLISKFTSWIAIPTEERKKFAQMIKEAKTAVKADQLAQDIIKGRIAEAVAKARYAALHKEIVEIVEFPDEFEAEHLHYPISATITDRVERLYGRPKNSNAILSELESKAVVTFKQLSWVGGGDREAILQLPYHADYLQAKLTGSAPNRRLDWEFLQKQCPTLNRMSERSSSEIAFDWALPELLAKILEVGLNDSTRASMDRLAKFRQKHQIQRNIDYLSSLSTARYDQKLGKYVEPTDARLAETAFAMSRIGISTETEFLDVAKYQRLGSECQALADRWYEKKQINKDELAKLHEKLAKLPPKMAESCIRNSLTWPFSAIHLGQMPDPETFRGPAEFLAAYQAKLDEYAEILPELKTSFNELNSSAKLYLDTLKENRRWDYESALSSTSSTSTVRASAKEKYVRALTWIYGDEKRAEKEVDELDLGERTRLLETYRKGAAAEREEVKASEEEFLKSPFGANDRYESYSQDRMRRLKLLIEIEGLEETGANPGRVRELQKELEPIIARMGDPLLSVELPDNTSRAVAIFPWGETRALALNPRSGEFQIRFDIPPTAVEGPGQIIVLGFDELGTPTVKMVPLEVDNTAPALSIDVQNGHLRIRDASKQVVRVKAFEANGQSIELEAHGSGEWISRESIQDLERVRVFAFDGAHNVARYLGGNSISLVASAPVETVKLVDRPAVELAGMNIQSVGCWQGIEFAGTLDEGLFHRRGGEAWQLLPGMPSQAARQFVPIGDELAVRFGSGDLVLLNEKLEARSLNASLPRHAALAIGSDSQRLVVAQTGGFTVIGESVSNWFEIPELAGGSPSAISIEGNLVRIGIQGRGMFVVDLNSRAVRSIAEPQGLGDDWVTALSGNLVGTFAAGAYSLSNGEMRSVSETMGMQVTGISAGGYVATRTGLYRVSSDRVSRIGPDQLVEVQGIAESGDQLLVATRNGVYRVRVEAGK